MAQLDTTAGTVLSFAPRWQEPLSWLAVLALYVTSAPADTDCCLCLDAREPDVPAEAVREMVTTAAEYLAEGRVYPDLLLVEEPIELERLAEPVAGADALAERLTLRPRRLLDDPREVVLHARWVKRILDAVQAELDRARFEASPFPRLEDEPLVTVRIPTYGDPALLRSRALPSVLNGRYRNLEVLVCSDGPQPATRAAVEDIGDPRVRYLELPARPSYPRLPMAFWQTAGIFALNHLLDEARGAVIAPLDHDDAFTVDHVDVLLHGLRAAHADFVHAQGVMEMANATWMVLGGHPLRHGHVVHGAVGYGPRLRHMRYDPHSWLIDEPGDWNLWRRMRATGAHLVHLPAPIVLHFAEGSSREGRAADPARVVEDTAADVLDTSAAALLEVASAARGCRLEAAEGRARASRPRRGALAPAQRRLAILDTRFPLPLSGFRWHEAIAMLELRPDTAFFALEPTDEPWPRPVYRVDEFAGLVDALGITDVYSVFLNATLGFLGLHGKPGARGVVAVPAAASVADVLRTRGLRLHAVLYPGGGLIPGTSPEVLRGVAERSATVFSNVPEVLDAVPSARRSAVPTATDFYAFRPRERAGTFSVVFAAADNPRKGLDTVASALALLDERFHLHVVGPHERHLHLLPAGRFTYHGWLAPAELREVYWTADAFASPVRPEAEGAAVGEEGLIDGFPTTAAADALASGCCLVSANPRGEHWLLEPDRHYLEIPGRDPEALAKALRRLAADRDVRDRLAAAGAARVRERMDVQTVAAEKLAAMGLMEAGVAC